MATKIKKYSDCFRGAKVSALKNVSRMNDLTCESIKMGDVLTIDYNTGSRVYLVESAAGYNIQQMKEYFQLI